jgi:hypothetical protein
MNIIQAFSKSGTARRKGWDFSIRVVGYHFISLRSGVPVWIQPEDIFATDWVAVIP